MISLVAINVNSVFKDVSAIWNERIFAYGICTALAIAWTLFAGKDIPWDALHYHVYAGFGALNDRLTTDLFPAGMQTYINPYSHVPLYLMLKAGWSALAIGAALATIHSVTLWITWELAHTVSRAPDGSSPAVVTWAAMGLALFNPVLLQELGSSFNDISTGALALAGYLALVKAFSRAPFRMVALGGVFLGAASALKLSNMIFMLLPALPLVLGGKNSTRERVRAVFIFFLCAAAGMLVAGAPWAWRLYEAFGNPLYPMLDGLFHTDQTATKTNSLQGLPPASFLETLGHFVQGMRDPRFLPSTLSDAVMRPFSILRSQRLVHTETMAADVRYAALFLLGVASVFAWRWRLRRSAVHSQVQSSVDSSNAFICLAISFAIGWSLWLAISGNSRYFVPMACIAGVLLVTGMYRLFAVSSPRMLWYALALLFCIQGTLFFHATEYRWSPQRWGGEWLQISMPKRLSVEPYLYLPLDSQSQSFLLPWLASGSTMVGIASGIAPESKEGRRAKELMETNVARLRMLKLVDSIESDGRPVKMDPQRFDYPLRRFGFEVDINDCDLISYQGNPSVTERQGVRAGARDQVQLYSCKVIPGPGETDAEQKGKQAADLILDRVEAECPSLFAQNRGGSWRSGEIWRRNYADLVVWVNDGGAVRFADLVRGGGDVIEIGRAQDWTHAKVRLRCWRDGGRAHVELQ